jgi:toxin ParE1/3/4
MIPIRWSREAQADIASIDDHYHRLNPGYADRIGRQAVKAAQFLANNPEAGQRVSARTRKWRVGGTPYLLFYRVDGTHLRIVRLMHAARDWRATVD